jgi:DNA-binding MarR family transcriptional regulator
MYDFFKTIHYINSLYNELLYDATMVKGNRTEPDAEPKLRGSTAFLLAQVGAHAATQFGERLTSLRLNRPHAGILRLIGLSPGLSQQELGRRLAILPSQLVALLDELQQRGLIERRQDPADRRTYALHLTASGRNVTEQIGRIAREHDDAICAALNIDERQQLNRLLGRIADQQGLNPGVHPGYRRLGRKPRMK